MSRPTCFSIDLDALRHNFQMIRKHAPSARMIAMVKANAYGHGLLRVARALPEADAFGVACLEEARVLRDGGCLQNIILMEGFFSVEELPLLSQSQCDVAIHNAEQLQQIETVDHLSQPLSVWIKINSGMNRLGFFPEEISDVFCRLKQCEKVKSVRLMSHLSDADVVDHAKTHQQIRVFKQLLKDFSVEGSLANSGGVLACPDSHCQWIRPGILLYGVSPLKGTVGEQYALKPVMHLSSKIIAIRKQRQGDAIGYGSTWVCPEDMPVGTVAVGYGDGYPWHAISGTPVLVNGIRSQIIGRVSMDMLTIDLRACPNADIGDEVVLWGRGLPVETVAEYVGTISYELLCSARDRSYP
ncbi:MAG: alanine racemase [Pseudomonadota bacterium]|nr:alanine racemase [Gammaproteobacteria bacterium]MBU1558722.1 alanine racemase [Gammaproteobacteria bacterium]MBU1629036.1 alanine racemase [Gammaproteobacteria bacterium]MBU1927006.1 alanine racemase [Gammaproteobacteria bacterium]MBU2546005.1 alanine racemase [Gammaproteobacteria bacterium]